MGVIVELKGEDERYLATFRKFYREPTDADIEILQLCFELPKAKGNERILLFKRYSCLVNERLQEQQRSRSLPPQDL